MGPESSGLQRRISLIKLDKSREEPKSSAAGERKELMLKSKPLLSIFGQFGFFGHAYSCGNEAPACIDIKPQQHRQMYTHGTSTGKRLRTLAICRLEISLTKLPLVYMFTSSGTPFRCYLSSHLALFYIVKQDKTISWVY